MIVRHFVQTLVIFLTLLDCSYLKAQTIITPRQVYDFQVGDVFIWQVRKYGPDSYHKTVVRERYSNTSGDSLYYLTNEYYFRARNCDTCSDIKDSTIGKISIYTHLDDTLGAHLGAKPYSLLYGSCFNDTTGFTGYWTDTIIEHSSYGSRPLISIFRWNAIVWMVDSCFHVFEPLWGYDNYVAGLGLAYQYSDETAQGTHTAIYQNNLVYYKKGSETFGTKPLMGMNESLPDLFSVSPNPFTSSISIEGGITGEATLIDSQGKERIIVSLSGTRNQMDTEDLLPGLYWIIIRNNSELRVRKLVKI